MANAALPRFRKLEAILSQPIGYDADRKARFLREAKAVLRIVADALGLRKGAYDLRVNKGGIAVSGEVTLHSDTLYIQISQSAVRLPPVLWRPCEGRKDYAGGPNMHLTLEQLAQKAGLA